MKTPAYTVRLNRTEIYTANSYEHAMKLINALRDGSIKADHLLGHKVLDAKKHTISICVGKDSFYNSTDLGKYGEYLQARKLAKGA